MRQLCGKRGAGGGEGLHTLDDVTTVPQLQRIHLVAHLPGDGVEGGAEEGLVEVVLG